MKPCVARRLGGVVSKGVLSSITPQSESAAVSCKPVRDSAEMLVRAASTLAARSTGGACDLAMSPLNNHHDERSYSTTATSPSSNYQGGLRMQASSPLHTSFRGQNLAWTSSRPPLSFRSIATSLPRLDPTSPGEKPSASGQSWAEQELADDVAARQQLVDDQSEALRSKTVAQIHAEMNQGDHFGKKIRWRPQKNPAYVPWTPSKDLKKRNILTKRMGFLKQELEKEQEEMAKAAKKFPAFGPGAMLEVQLEVPENKRRPATVRGTVIAIKNRSIRTSFTLRNHLGTAGAFERSFPLYSPSIKSIKVLGQRRVRRAKLYYLRERNPKEYRV